MINSEGLSPEFTLNFLTAADALLRCNQRLMCANLLAEAMARMRITTAAHSDLYGMMVRAQNALHSAEPSSVLCPLMETVLHTAELVYWKELWENKMLAPAAQMEEWPAIAASDYPVVVTLTKSLVEFVAAGDENLPRAAFLSKLAERIYYAGRD